MEKIVIQEIHRMKEIMGITENKKPNISESTFDDQDKYELYQYGMTYMGGPEEKNCQKLIQDGKLLEKAIEEGKLKMDPKDIKEFKTNLIYLEAGSVVPGCKAIKPTLIKKFQEGFESNYQKAKINLCWFAENIDKKQLNACKSKTQTQSSEQTIPPQCDENGCKGTYVGPQFDANCNDVAHQFSNTMTKAVAAKLKELFKQKIYVKVDLDKIAISTSSVIQGCNQNNTIYSVDIPFVKVQTPCEARTGFGHVGGWGHEGAGVEKRKSEIYNDTVEDPTTKEKKRTNPVVGTMDDMEYKRTSTKEKLVEYWIQWKHSSLQSDCGKPQVDTPQAQPEVKPQAQPEVKPQAQPEVKPQAQPEVKPSVSPQSNTPQIKRVVRRF